MSLVALQAPSPVPLQFDRKRTASFSYPRAKVPRMGALVRSETLLNFEPSSAASSSSSSSSLKRTESYISTVPYTRTLQYYKDQREQRKRATLSVRSNTSTSTAIPRTTVRQLSQAASAATRPRPKRRAPPPTVPLPSVPTTTAYINPVPIHIVRSSRPKHHPLLAPYHSHSSTSTSTSPPRSTTSKPLTRPPTSPLSPTPLPLPPRPIFPRSKPEPDLRRKALKTLMRGSPEGQKILRMGPHLAVSMMDATRELERIVNAQEAKESMINSSEGGGEEEMQDMEGESEPDVAMQDVPALVIDAAPMTVTPPMAALTKSWIVLPPPPMQENDWEMVTVECAA